ncbi:hypothetical protein Tco_1311960 [Tanacetum coccineum]
MDFTWLLCVRAKCIVMWSIGESSDLGMVRRSGEAHEGGVAVSMVKRLFRNAYRGLDLFVEKRGGVGSNGRGDFPGLSCFCHWLLPCETGTGQRSERSVEERVIEIMRGKREHGVPGVAQRMLREKDKVKRALRQVTEGRGITGTAVEYVSPHSDKSTVRGNMDVDGRRKGYGGKQQNAEGERDGGRDEEEWKLGGQGQGGGQRDQRPRASKARMYSRGEGFSGF